MEIIFPTIKTCDPHPTMAPKLEIVTQTLNCEVVVDDLESACTVTRFFLSSYPDWDRSVTHRRVLEYVQKHFTDPRGYRLSCDQDVLVLQRR